MNGVRINTEYGRATIVKEIKHNYYLAQMDKGETFFVTADDIKNVISGVQTAAALAFANAGDTFHGYDIQNYANGVLKELKHKKTHCFVDTFMRVLRGLRQQGLINYIVVDRQESKYKKV